MRKLVLSRIWSEGKLYDWMVIHSDLIENIGIGAVPDLKFTETIDLKSSFIIPGLIDSHIHVGMLGESLSNLDIGLCKDLSQFKELLHKPMVNNWILFNNWNDTILPLTIHDIAHEKPVIVFRQCLHLCLLNQTAMELIKEIPIKSEWVNVETGVLKEGALFAVKQFIYKSMDPSIIEKYYTEALNHCKTVYYHKGLRNGITTVQTNDFFGAWPVYKELYQKGEIPIRVYLTVPIQEAILNDEDTDRTDAPLPNDTFGIVSCHRVKLFVDGSLGASTAALREGYTDHSCNHGLLIQTQKELEQLMESAHTQGYRLEMHVIGDKALEVALNCLETCNIQKEDRPILTHCQITPPDLIQKMKQLGVIANVQPSFVTSDASFAETRLGKDRLEYAYCWKTLLSHGVHVSGGSDAPVVSVNPFLGIHASIYRNITQKQSNQSPSSIPVFGPKERLSFEEAFQLYTTSGAYTAGDEDKIGKLAKGYYADFTVIDREIWKSSIDSIDETWNLLLDVNVQQVWVGGIKRF